MAWKCIIQAFKFKLSENILGPFIRSGFQRDINVIGVPVNSYIDDAQICTIFDKYLPCKRKGNDVLVIISLVIYFQSWM